MYNNVGTVHHIEHVIYFNLFLSYSSDVVEPRLGVISEDGPDLGTILILHDNNNNNINNLIL